MSSEIEVRHGKLTRFLCQELLFEYLTGQLAERRREDVESFLSTCHDSRRELENMMKGLEYASKVAQIEVSSEYHQALLGFEPNWKKRIREMTLWSSQRGWRALPLIFLTLAIALGLIVTKPWKPPTPGTQTLVDSHIIEPPPTETRALPRTILPEVPNLKLAGLPPAPSVPPAIVGTQAAADTPPLVQAPHLTETPASLTKPKPIEVQTQEVLIGTGKGFIYRGDIRVKDFATVWPAIRSKITELDGEAAGSVELGWLRHPNESYFHFSIPESNLSSFEEFLKTFGPVRIVKERHPRVMPKGQIRIILTVKDGEAHEGAAQAP